MSRRRRLYSAVRNMVLAGQISREVTFTRASSATFFDANGILQTAANNIPRIDHLQDGSGLKGLRIEGARTNKFIHSEDFTNWNEGNTIVTANQSAAPDGTTNMDEIANNTSTSEHHIERNSFTVTSGTTAVMSVYAKAGTEDVIVFWNNRSGGFCTFDLTAVTASGAGTITAIGGGIFYCRCPFTPAGGDWILARVYLRQTSSYTGASETIFLWGAQLEEATFESSYILTTTVAVTRAADVCTIDLTGGNWFNPMAGTIFIDWTDQILGTGGNASLFSISDDTIGNRIGVFKNLVGSRQFRVVSGGSASVNTSHSSSNYNAGRHRNAVAYDTNDYAYANDGVIEITDSSVVIPAVTTLYIGANYQGGEAMYGIITDVRYYPQRLSNAQIVEITA